ncbi:MAG TPA: sigma-70 family RNA polymerase sigma factor [Myxococcota bacterium]|nr:sigma-70 family RNA polymerase sigma factor [Myxococcota bacterium]
MKTTEPDVPDRPLIVEFPAHRRAPPDADEALYAAGLEGDDQAWEELYRRHGPTTYNYLLRRLGRFELADDAQMQAWERIRFPGRARYDPARGRLKPWLLGVAHNAGREALRWDRRIASWFAPRGRRGPAVFHYQEQLRTTDDGSAGPESAHLSEERRRVVQAALERLSDSDRALLSLSADGLSHEELQEVLDLSPSAVKMRLSRARQRLKELLLQEGFQA